MAELIDVLTASGLRTGEVLSRSEVHRLGKYHRAVHLYIFNNRDEVLLQRRSMSVDHYPGMFGISVTGHIAAGESSSDAMRREVNEEIGVDAHSLRMDFQFSFFQEAVLSETYVDRQFNDVYVARFDLDPAAVRLDPREVVEIKYVSFDTFRQMVEDGSGGLAPVYANECRDLVYFLEHSSSGVVRR